MREIDLNGADIATALRTGARHLDGAALDARVLLMAATGLNEAALIASPERRLDANEHRRYSEMVSRRAKGEPVAYIVGRKEFWSLDLAVCPGVLTPRPDSETLIEAAIARRPPERSMRMLDLGTGSGCLVCALLDVFPRAVGIGVDKSESAVRQARANAEALGFGDRAQFFVGDWTAALSGSFELIIANPPYIPERDRETLAATIRDFEPGEALFAGPDGFDAYRAIFEAAPMVLAEDGLMIIEAGDGQAAALASLARTGFPRASIEICNDLGGRPRAVVVDRSFTQKK